MLEQEEINYLEKTLESLRYALTKLSDYVHLQNEHYKDLQKYLIDYKAEVDK